MKQILYITANTKSEELSSSKTVGRALIKRLITEYPGVVCDEIDLYKDHIPRLKAQYFISRSALPDEADRQKFTSEEQEEIRTIEALCDRFKSADITVLACPMWSMSFPSVVKEFLDCIILTGRTVEFRNDHPHGMLKDRQRTFIYVQSSGASLPFFLRPMMNRGGSYLRSVMRFLGITEYFELLVDGTGADEKSRQAAVRSAIGKIPALVSRIEG